MALYQEWWFIITLIAAVIFVIVALLYFFWVGTSEDTPWWVWGGVILSLILVIIAFVVYAVEKAKRDKMASVAGVKWICQPVCTETTKTTIEKVMLGCDTGEKDQDSLYPPWMR